MKVNVYDFDHTVYAGDSSVDFYLFCVKKQPDILRFLPGQASAAIRCSARRLDKTAAKARFFSFLAGIEDTERMASEFWGINRRKIQPWYLEQKKDTDIVISASPEFLLKPICNELNIRLIASLIDEKTGKFKGENCYGKEKLYRLNREYPNIEVNNFYSDSQSDAPLARFAEHSYLVKSDKFEKFG